MLGGGAALAGLLAFTANLLVDEQIPGWEATYRTLLLTIAVPAGCVLVFLLVRWFQSRKPAGGRLPAALLVAVLLGLGLTNALELARGAADLELDNPRGGEWARPPSEFTSGAQRAAEWLEENSAATDIVATNVHCADPAEKRCDNRSFWVSWLTERRIVVEGWGYTRETNDARSQGRAAYLPIPDPERLQVNDAAFLQPSAETVGRLAETYDVSWLFVSKDYPVDLAGLRALEGDVLERGFSNDNYVVFEVLD
jgi:hypothetical protein